MKKFVLLFACTFCFLSGRAEDFAGSVAVRDNDTVSSGRTGGFSRKIDDFSSSRLYGMTYIGVPLIAGGLIAKSEDKHFRSLRNENLPRFRYTLDDKLQYLPAVVMLGMKSFGVEGRSSWKRMLASDAYSILLMASTVNVLKRTARVERPDGSNDKSFPSGHTATAFMTATMLNKEYADKSPWIGVGAYGVATATGLMRMANNKHWLSDVLTGAGIGVLSVEFGYYLADMMFKDKGIRYTAGKEVFDRMDKPSFVGLYLGVNVPLSNYDVDEQNRFRTSSGVSSGIEGACFFNPYTGLGGRFVVSNVCIITNGNQAENDSFDAMSLCGGGYFSYPVSSRWLVGGKLLGGYLRYPRLELSGQTIPAKDGFCSGSGVALTFRAKEYYGIRFFLDHNLLPSHSLNSREWMNTLSCGLSFAVTL